uniref:MAM domain-containing protein n=1 Tax=Neogobius melanostomus TaxID=47308 RepID=A0A8C6SB82_9GOBI
MNVIQYGFAKIIFVVLYKHGWCVSAALVGAQRQTRPGSCNFESHTCGYTSDPDFTTNTAGDPAQPLLELEEWSCLRLVYQVSGEGSLDVLQRSEGQSFDWPLWSTAAPSESWLISSVDLSNTSLPFRQKVQMDISTFECCLHVCLCVLTDCDFEESRLCGYSNQWNANVNWYVGGGSVQLLDNDLTHDHASTNPAGQSRMRGHFMYVDSLHALTFHEVAKLLSPMTSAPMSGCLSFQYQRSEGRGNRFSVYTRDQLGQYQELWRARPESLGPQRPAEWESIQVDLKAPYSVVFEVAFNSPRGGRVAVDDISFSPEFCSADTEPTFDPTVGSCDFDEGLCEFTQAPGAPWRRVSVRPNIFRSGDHTTGAGSFLLAHSQLGPRSGYVSRLVGPNLPGNTKFCLRFYFSLRGTALCYTLHALSVYLQRGRVQEKIWTQGEKSRGIWIQGDVSFTTSGPSKVVFVSVCRSLWDCGSVALDDISLALGHCELSTGALTVSAHCDFESGLCGYSQDRHGDDAEWYRRRGPTPTSYTGPRGDHTIGLGYYVHLEASPLLPGQSARLRSPSLRGSRGPQCLLFHFHMYGSGTGRLSVRMDDGGEERVLWEREGEQGIGWLRAALQYHSDRQNQIVFVATRGSSVRSDIAIDDITLESGPCPDQFIKSGFRQVC